MYNNKKRVNEQLEQGVDDPVDIIEDLYSYINSLISAINDVQADVELQDYIDEWEN